MTTKKTTQSVFLNDIIEQPDDDDLRKIYADWLEEDGDEDDQARAELIRVQCDLARYRRAGLSQAVDTDDSLEQELLAREAHLLRRHGKKWKAEVSRYGSLSADSFRRGLLEHLNFTVATYLAGGSAAHARTPLRSVSLSPGWGGDALPDGGFTQLLRRPFLDRLESVEVSHVSDDMAFRFFGSPRLDRVQAIELDLGHSPARESAEQLSVAPWASRLTSLRLDTVGSVGRVTRPSADVLAGSPSLARLEYLALRRTGETAASLGALARSAHLSRLRELQLTLIRLMPARLAALADSPALPALVHLGLDHCGVDDAGLEALAAGRLLERLRRLELVGNHFGDGGVIALAQSPRAVGLEVLDLRGNPITDLGARALLESSHLTGLRELRLDRGFPISLATTRALRQRFKL